MTDGTCSGALPDFTRGDGLLPAIAQDSETGEVLMLAYMNAESFAETVATGRAVYYSRSRGRLWRKGEESGHVQLVSSILVDCDGDTILLRVRQTGGAACHEGYRSCFFREVTPDGFRVIGERVFDPTDVYGEKETTRADDGLPRPPPDGVVEPGLCSAERGPLARRDSRRERIIEQDDAHPDNLPESNVVRQ